MASFCWTDTESDSGLPLNNYTFIRRPVDLAMTQSPVRPSLGLSNSLRLLVVAHCYRSAGNVIRIISARKAMADEERYYL